MTMLFCIAESEIKVIHTYIHTIWRRVFIERLSTANTGVFPLISLMHVFIQMTVGDFLGEQGYVEAIF